jgi:hypothetical protein
MINEGIEARPQSPPPGALSFEVTNVTMHDSFTVSDVQPSLPARALAEALAAKMSLPQNTPWALRDDTTSEYLDDEKPIGEQVSPGARLTVTPKAHLG